ncbi:MAG: rhodanese-like domain-containing protein [Desulfobacterales bacterium]|nr:MAG: rhodanese-like domain-containing protein [Desulfobacterales bacterium]
MSRPGLTMVAWLAILVFYSSGMTVTAGAEAGKFNEITAPEVKELIDGGNVLLVHVLSEIEFNMQHITGSINIPITAMKTTDKLPQDLDTPLAFYCMGLR